MVEFVDEGPEDRVADRPLVLATLHTNDSVSAITRLLDMGIEWKPSMSEEHVYEGHDRSSGERKWTATAVDLDFAEVDQAVEQGIERGIYPGAVVVIGRRDSIIYARGYGHFTWNRTSPVPSPDSTLWDIASITKVVSTAASALRLVDQGKLDLEAPVRRYLPRFSGGPKNQVTVRMLLDHTSGLKSYVPFYLKARGSRARAIDLLYAQPLVRVPGDSAEYSDLNALFLGLVLEKVSGLPLDKLAKREVFGPLGMTQTIRLDVQGMSCTAPRLRRSRVRATRITRAPSAVRRSAMAAPMPSSARH